MYSMLPGLNTSGKLNHKSFLDTLSKILTKYRFLSDTNHSIFHHCISHIDEILNAINLSDLAEASAGKEHLFRACLKMKSGNSRDAKQELDQANKSLTNSLLKSKEFNDLMIATKSLIFCEFMKTIISFELISEPYNPKETCIHYLQNLNSSEKVKKIVEQGNKLLKMASNEEKRLDRLSEILLIHFQTNIIFCKLTEFKPDILNEECELPFYSLSPEKNESPPICTNQLAIPQRSNSLTSLTSICSIRRSNSSTSLGDSSLTSNFIYVQFPLKNTYVSFLHLANYLLKKDKTNEAIIEAFNLLMKCLMKNQLTEENLLFKLFSNKDYEFLVQSLEQTKNTWTEMILLLTENGDLRLLEFFTLQIFKRKDFKSILNNVEWNDILIPLINKRSFENIKLLPWRYSISLCMMAKSILQDYESNMQFIKAIIEGSDVFINELSFTDISLMKHGGKAAASSYLLSPPNVQCLFVDNDSDSWFSENILNSNNEYIIRELPCPTIIIAIALKQSFKCFRENFPSKYSLQASNDYELLEENGDNQWTVLLEVTDDVLEGDDKWQFHPIEKRQEFSVYKLKIEETLCSRYMKSEPIIISQIKLFTDRIYDEQFQEAME